MNEAELPRTRDGCFSTLSWEKNYCQLNGESITQVLPGNQRHDRCLTDIPYFRKPQIKNVSIKKQFFKKFSLRGINH